MEKLGAASSGKLVDTVAPYDAIPERDAIDASIEIHLGLRADDPSLAATRQMPGLLRDLIGQ